MPLTLRALTPCLLAALVLGLAACGAPPARAPVVVVPAADGGALPGGGAGGGNGGEGGAGGGQDDGYGAIVPHAAEVTEEEIAADGQVRTVSPASGGDRGAAGRAGGGGGRTPPARYALPAASAAGVTATPRGAAPGAAPDPAWTGTDFGTRAAGADDTVTAPPVGDLERAKREAATRVGVDSGLAGGRGGRLDPLAGARGAGGAAASSTGLGRTPDDSDTASGIPGSRPFGAAQLALPDAAGDDVLAKQLREAAEQERDPPLRAKLWEEYRRYRAGLDGAP